jgi:hypothetical protein
MRTLIPNIPMTPLIETIATFYHFYRLVEVDLPPFLNDFHLKITFVLDKEAFIFTLTHFPSLSYGGYFRYGV